MSKILSVVIPTYNMEKYLNNCLDSFIYDKDTKDLEVLIVNDGSKDKSLEIAKDYENKYPDIFKVVDKENGGHGSTINAGLKVATGKYFKVVDADDWVITENFKELVEQLKDLDVDCICSNYTHVYEQSNKTELVDMCNSKNLETLKIENIESFVFAMHSLTFKTSAIREVRLTEHCFYVDVEYNLFGFAKCETLKYIPLNIYQYRLGRVGQSVSPQGFYKHRNDRIKVCKNIVEFLQTLDKNSNKYKLIFKDVVSILKYFYTDYILIYGLGENLDKEVKAVDEWLKSYPELYAQTNDHPKIKKMRETNFKKLKTYYQVHAFKQFIKKCLGRK